MKQSIEATYPAMFRETDVDRLAELIRQHNSVVIAGMKRVGINNLLRFFLFNPEVTKTKLSDKKYLFVLVDLNDLVERELYPFWVLLLKRLIDTLEGSTVPENGKKQARKLFTESIQLKDMFFTVDSVQKVLNIIIAGENYPVLVLNRFDRLKDAATPEFFSNLQGLKEATRHRLSFIFTSFRPLHQVNPAVFTKAALSVFAQTIYVKPATRKDSDIIYTSLCERYNLNLPNSVKQVLIDLAGGHVHYLQLMLIRLKDSKEFPTSEKNGLELFSKDEEIHLQSEELFANLTKPEQDTLHKISRGETIAEELMHQAAYLWDTGMVSGQTLFSPLFAGYLKTVHISQNGGTEFTKKEHLLYSYLLAREGNLCEREALVQVVWAEQSEAGVSDWAIDRLVARVRSKLKKQNSQHEIVTVITRGYKLVKKQ